MSVEVDVRFFTVSNGIILVRLYYFLYSNKICMQILQQHMRAGLVLQRAALAASLVESTFCCEVRCLHECKSIANIVVSKFAHYGVCSR